MYLHIGGGLYGYTRPGSRSTNSSREDPKAKKEKRKKRDEEQEDSSGDLGKEVEEWKKRGDVLEVPAKGDMEHRLPTVSDIN
jgi:hypothetical protein